MKLMDKQLDAPMGLSVVRWQGHPHCVYLNDHRIAGGKPWGGGETLKEWERVTLRDIVRAIPALQSVLELDYLGNPKK